MTFIEPKKSLKTIGRKEGKQTKDLLIFFVRGCIKVKKSKTKYIAYENNFPRVLLLS